MGTLVQNSNRTKRRTAGTWVDYLGVNGLKRRSGGTWVNVNVALRRSGGAWVYFWTTPDVNCSFGGPATGSGASASGTASVAALATPGGSYISLTYSWQYVSGDTGIAPSNAASSNPFFSRTFSGVANGTTSAGVSAVWRCYVTDITGAQAYHDLTIGPLAWQNTIPAYNGHTDHFSPGQSGNVTAPAGANSVVIWVIGGGGQGGSGYNDGLDTKFGGGGGGGGGGGRARWSGSVTGGSTSFSYAVGGLNGTSNVNGGVFGGGGGNGDSGSSGGGGGGGSAGGASGGNIENVGGGAGGSSFGESGGSGGSGNTGPDGSTYGIGAEGASAFGGGGGATGGAVFFVWSP